MNKQHLLATYFPVADPLMPLSQLQAYATARVDFVELGIKADDPFEDGTVIRESMLRCGGTGVVNDALDAIETVRGFDHQAVGMIFGYASATFADDDKFWRKVDALLCLGSSRKDVKNITSSARSFGTRITKFVPYHYSSEDLSDAIAADCYVMLQYLDGKTGARSDIATDLANRLKKLRSEGVTIPVLTGIGISTKEQVSHAMDAGADGVVIGSKAVEKGLESFAALEDYLCMIREVLDGR